ncbi:MAG: iron ABC transporter permease [Spirochaetes bacterium]|nr:iron ABC transporter permease [Spirochaetota bacterium]
MTKICTEAGRKQSARTGGTGIRLGQGTLAGSVLFPLLLVFILLPVLAAFRPLLDGGLRNNVLRALTEPRFLYSFRFGLGQALASTACALLLGLPGAFLLARRRFAGKRLLAALTVIPFSMPALIVAIGFVLYYGHNGLLNRLLMALFNLQEPPLRFLYSFQGLVLAHGFYNFPLVMRYVADAWERVSANQEDAARLLGAGRLRVFRTVTLPAILPAVGSAATLVFLLCFFSFVIVMLFSGPGISTPEVEIYRAARFEFDKPLASAFALAETLIAILVLALYALLEAKTAGADQGQIVLRPPQPFKNRLSRLLAALYGLLVLFFFGGPLIAIIVEAFSVRGRSYASASLGVQNFLRLYTSSGFRTAFANTILLGLLAAFLATISGILLAVSSRSFKSLLLTRILPLLPLAISSVVLAFGWSSLLGSSSLLVIALVQAVSAYPFIFKAIQGSVGRNDEKYLQAARTLGSSRYSAFLRVGLPLALPAILSGFAFAFAISAGDANALIVAPVSGLETLASYLYKLAGSYRFNEACAAAVILSVLTAFVFFLKDLNNGKA